MITVRPALADDLPQIFRMSMRFLETHPVGPYDEAYVYDLASAIIDKGIAIIADINGHPCGMILALETVGAFDPSTPVVQEIAWWVDEDARSAGVGGELMDLFQFIIGERHATMYTLPTSGVAREFFENRGWALTHEVWTKGFGR